ncbi:MAG TPA: vWA domain-containing protein [Gaiellaceae bacterium]|nr:vWA domain-containing protein [Gaiellaceae bacterium]
MLRLAGEERGQVLPLFAAGMAVVLLAVTAFVLDVGNAMSVKRQLQGAADAAALAAAADLPNGATAAATARQYAPGGGRNAIHGAASTSVGVTVRCANGASPCASPDVVTVSEQAVVSTSFARVFGLNSFTVHASSTAARTTISTQLDVALVLDRTGSMSGEMANLRTGADAFLAALDPSLDRVALIVLPPVPQGGNACSSMSSSAVGDDWYPIGSDGAYAVDHLTSNFAHLKSDIDCLQAGGSTSYKQALVAARAELLANGRPGATKAIVFETDGAANTVPDSAYAQPDQWLDLGGSRIVTGTPLSSRLDDVLRPCGSAVDYAASVAGDTRIYTVGYHLSGDQICYQAPHLGRSPVGYKQIAESITAPAALSGIAAATGGTSFLQEDGTKLASTFAAVAKQLAPPRLVPEGFTG